MTMNEVVASVKCVTDIMIEIANASQEQSADIDEMNRAFKVTYLSNSTAKIKSILRAERDGVIQNIHVKPGSQVAAKDLLIEWQA